MCVRHLKTYLREAAVTKLVTKDVTTQNVSEDEIVESESDKLVAVQTLQRKSEKDRRQFHRESRDSLFKALKNLK